MIVDTKNQTLNLGATGLEEIAQNVRIIASTIKKTVPLDRDFGIDGDLLDLPAPIAQAKLSSELVQAIERYEPRVKVTEISYGSDLDGLLIPKIRIKLKDIL